MIPSLTDDIVYCPKCGAINSFKKSKSGKMLNLFCSRCQARLNELWDKYQKGIIAPVICFYCNEATFKGEVYCIACGAKQQKVRKDRTEKLSQAKIRDLNSEDTREGTDKFSDTMRIYVRKYY